MLKCALTAAPLYTSKMWTEAQTHRSQSEQGVRSTEGRPATPPRPKASIANVQTQQDTCRAPVSTHALMLHSYTVLHILNHNQYSKWIRLSKHRSNIYPTNLNNIDRVVTELRSAGKYCVCRNWFIGLATITDSYEASFMILVIYGTTFYIEILKNIIGFDFIINFHLWSLYFKILQ